MSVTHLIFAFPDKRLQSAIMFFRGIESELRNQRIDVAFIVKNRNDYNTELLRDLKDVKVVDVSEAFQDFGVEQQSPKSETSKAAPQSNLDTTRRGTVFKAIRDLARRMGRDLSFGQLDKVIEQLIVYRILFRAEKIRSELMKNGIDIEKDQTIFMMETDRGSSFERPLLLIRNRFEKSRVILLELADSATEKDLIYFAKEKFHKPLLNRYKRIHLESYKSQVYKERLYLQIPETRAMEILEIGSKFPWRIGLNNSVDLTLLRRPSVVAEYEYLSSKERKFAYLGDPISEYLYNPRRSNIPTVEGENLEILLAMPQFMVTQREFRYIFQKSKKIRKSLEDLVQSLSEIAIKVTIVLHPKLSWEDYKVFNSIPNVVLSRNSIHDELQRHNCLVSTESSVMKFAWLLKMPVLVYLPRQWRLTALYSEINASRSWTKIIGKRGDLLELKYSGFFDRTRAYYASKAYEEELSENLLDGKYGERLVSEIRKLF